MHSAAFQRGQRINPHYIHSRGEPFEELWLDAARASDKAILEVTSKQPEKMPWLHAALCISPVEVIFDVDNQRT